MTENATKQPSQDAPLLSVLISTYNHEAYIEQCLRSIAAQKTTFPFEVIVGEDCSKDNTRNVLKALEPELPSNFTILYREKNMGAVANGEDLYARATGKYLIDYESDDFFLEDTCFQENVEFLESHPEYVASYSQCLVVGIDGKPNGEHYPQCPDEEYSFKEFFYSCLPGHFGTCVCRRQLYVDSRDTFMKMREYKFYPGDRRNAFLFLCAGKVRCVQRQQSAYRHVTHTGSSYCANVKFDKQYIQDEVLYGKALVDYAIKFGSQEAIDTAKMTRYRLRLKWCFDDNRVESLSDVLADLKKEDHRLRLLLSPLRWYAVLASRKLRGRAIDL